MRRPSTGLAILYLACLAPILSGQSSARIQIPLTLADPCAVFRPAADESAQATPGEPVDFNVQGTVQATVDKTQDGRPRLKFLIDVRGDGTGQTSAIQYRFASRAIVQADTQGSNPADPGFNYSATYPTEARLIGQRVLDADGRLAQPSQDNASLRFVVTVQYAGGNTQADISGFALECAESPWSNQMTAPEAGSEGPIGRGFGDPWNKYAWSMKDFNGGLLVGTQSAFFDYHALQNPVGDLAACIAASVQPPIYSGITCLELMSGTAARDTRYAGIWRLDYSAGNWTRVFRDGQFQGFRNMEIHKERLYVGADLGSFASGVDLHAGAPGHQNFPGSRLLVSSDGLNFETVPCPDAGPCNSARDVAGSGNANVSFRALASFQGKLYLGTFNLMGGELWSYDDSTGVWEMVKKFSRLRPAVTELCVYRDKLYIGLGGFGTADYLWVYDGANPPDVAPGLVPMTSLANIGVLKLFVSSNGLLYVGNADLTIGFTLLRYDGRAVVDTVTANGFFNRYNAYPWSIAEVDGRMFVGTLNQKVSFDITVDWDHTPPPLDWLAELWYTDDAENWRQIALPPDWGPWGYGIRNLEIANDRLYLGSATNIAAPDLVENPAPITPGTEVWTLPLKAASPATPSRHPKMQ